MLACAVKKEVLSRLLIIDTVAFTVRPYMGFDEYMEVCYASALLADRRLSGTFKKARSVPRLLIRKHEIVQ